MNKGRAALRAARLRWKAKAEVEERKWKAANEESSQRIRNTPRNIVSPEKAK